MTGIYTTANEVRAIFIDTGAFLAKEIVRDQHHRVAAEGWSTLVDQGVRLVSSEHVLDETATLLARRTTFAFAAEWGRDVFGAGIEWLKADESQWTAAFDAMRKYADQGVSYTDALSFVLMRRHRIRHAFGFDRHFLAAGFRLWPEPAA